MHAEELGDNGWLQSWRDAGATAPRANVGKHSLTPRLSRGQRLSTQWPHGHGSRA